MTLPNNIDECWVSEGAAPGGTAKVAQPLGCTYVPLPDITAFELQELIPYLFLGKVLYEKSQLSEGSLRHLRFPTEQSVTQHPRFMEDPKYRMVRDELKDASGVHRITETELGHDDDLAVGADVWVPPELRQRWKNLVDRRKVEFV